MSNKPGKPASNHLFMEPLFDGLVNRRRFIQLAMGTMASIALSPVCEVFALSLPVGNVNIAVISDLHYYAPELGTSSPVFTRWQDKSMKLLADSKNTVISALNTVLHSDAQIVLVPGDLTKDGELICHQQVADLLTQLTTAGKKVYVICGNHDIYNPNAWDFNTDTPTLVDNIGPSDFKSIYDNFGYKQAIATDPNSLSYVVEPYPGLRLIAMDDCLYTADNKNIPNTPVNLDNHAWSMSGGAFSDNTLNWIKSQIQEATSQGIPIIGMMHHSIVPHFSLEPTTSSTLIVENYATVGRALSRLGLKVVFTGHLHAQSISEATYDANTLIDIETGSLVTYPLPIRFVQLTPAKNKLIITTSVVTNSASPLDPALDGNNYPNLQSYAKGFLAELLPNTFVSHFSTLFRTSLSLANNHPLSAATATDLAHHLAQMPATAGGPTLDQLFTEAMIANCHGDYTPDAHTQSIYTSLATSTDPTYGPYLSLVGQYLCSIGQMDSPALLGDNNLTLTF